MSAPNGYENPAIAGSGTIACGLAATASQLGPVKLLARSDASAWRAEETAQAQARKVEGGAPDRIRVTTDPAALGESDLIVEAITEELGAKAELIRTLAEVAPAADLASTTSSLSVDELADQSATPTRLFGLHVFSPVTKMELVELCFPPPLADAVAERARTWCGALGKTAVDVPDIPGFVVNRLMFPALFEAVRLVESTHLDPADLDTCMKLGAGHPMGPLQLLDFVGLDVAAAIGDSLHADSGRESDKVPERIRTMIAEGKLGRKSGEGFYTY
jgi:3-hydroxybutyryl-CoA dehydrogenase